MVLSGVARTESRFACGKNLIAQMLCGSNSAKIKKLRLNQLSTFGLLWQLKQAEVTHPDRYPDRHRLPGAGRHRSLPAGAQAHAAGRRRNAGQGRLARRLEAAGRTAAQAATAGRQGCIAVRRSHRAVEIAGEVQGGQRSDMSVAAANKSAAECPAFGQAPRWRIMKVRRRRSLGLSDRWLRTV